MIDKNNTKIKDNTKLHVDSIIRIENKLDLGDILSLEHSGTCNELWAYDWDLKAYVEISIKDVKSIVNFLTSFVNDDAT